MPSMAIKMASVKTDHGAKKRKMATPPNHEFMERPLPKTIPHKTSDSSVRKSFKLKCN